ncbi:MAG TPA: hypothetical protein DHV28_08570 [Ignavibacteriales bacterium]|nr:hypothetical protein [Ignavibacteriales bacterium]
MTRISFLNYEGFQTLQKLCLEFKTNTNPWFESSYPAFVNHALSKIDDLIPLIAYAYSWMPTIPTVNFELLANDKYLFDELKRLQSASGYNLYELMRKLIPAINNSIVGTSKVLHFIAPETIAIIDSRVARAWKKHINFGDVSFPDTFSRQNVKTSIDNYVNYNYLMNMWRDDIKQYEKDIKLRDLEFMLYRLGGNDID